MKAIEMSAKELKALKKAEKEQAKLIAQAEAEAMAKVDAELSQSDETEIIMDEQPETETAINPNLKPVLAVVTEVMDKYPMTAKQLTEPLIQNMAEYIAELTSDRLSVLKCMQRIVSKVKALEKDGKKSNLSVYANINGNYKAWFQRIIEDQNEIYKLEAYINETKQPYIANNKPFYVAYTATLNNSTGISTLEYGRPMPLKACGDTDFLFSLITSKVVTKAKREKDTYKPVTVCIIENKPVNNDYVASVDFFTIDKDGKIEKAKGLAVLRNSNLKKAIINVHGRWFKR